MMVLLLTNHRKIMNLELFAKMRGYEQAFTSTNSQFLDHILNGKQGDEIREKVLTKRLQFDTTPELYQRVEDICVLLDSSKRQFLEMAVIDAINKGTQLFLASYKEATGYEFGEVVNEGEAE